MCCRRNEEGNDEGGMTNVEAQGSDQCLTSNIKSSPKSSAASDLAPASWSAAVLCRFGFFASLSNYRVVYPTQSGRGQPHSKTLARGPMCLFGSQCHDRRRARGSTARLAQLY